ncbi:MAG TPA: hypothetical protein VFV46_02520, partial [Lacibacter sp.]|nr:hypothetical protein [Lacibacter sp.]
MKKKLTFFSTYVFLFLFTSVDVKAQCTDATVKWDLLDFLHAPTFATTARAQNQRFTIGKNSLNITHNYTDANAFGENATHTGSTGSFGTGEDVQFMGDGTITFTFLNSVTNARFSLYDVDVNQRITVTATNGITPVPVTMVQPSGSTITIVGSGTVTAVGTANATANATTSNGSTLNITVAGTVTSITISVSVTGTVTTGPAGNREDGSFWLSDIIACDAGVFATNYRAVAQPIAGMPSYVLTVR